MAEEETFYANKYENANYVELLLAFHIYLQRKFHT